MGTITFTISPSTPLFSPPIHTFNLAFQPKFLAFSRNPHFNISKLARTTAAGAGFQTPTPKTSEAEAARDRVIDFGKYKGKMMGTLPSSYLKWVSENLRLGQRGGWAKLADEVLSDPVYRDRMEWEVAERVLTGNVAGSGDINGAEELFEISERFGWDFDDKSGGWSKINFELLGTSQGGRIPRVRKGEILEEKIERKEKRVGGRRAERIERSRMRKGEKTSISSGMNNEDGGGDEGGGGGGGGGSVGLKHRFPGREALLKRVLNGRRV